MSDSIIPRGASEAHYEALRKAYDQRVKNLSRKLRGDEVSSGPGTNPSSGPLNSISNHNLNLNNTVGSTSAASSSQYHPAHNNHINFDDLDQPDNNHHVLKQRESQITTLVEKCAHISRESEKKHDELRGKLNTTLSEAQEQKKELYDRIGQMQNEAREERDWFERSREDMKKGHQEEISKLMERITQLESENRSLQEQNNQMQSMLEENYQIRQSMQSEVVEFTKQQEETAVKLRESQELLKQSELERQQLRDQYLNVGEKFETLIDLEEKENCETIKQLNTRFKLLKDQKNKMQKKQDSRIAELEHQLQEKGIEIERLNGVMSDERNRFQKTEHDLIEAQKQTLHEHNLQVAKLSEMMPISSHQQLLEECRRSATQQNLETEQNLRQQYQKQLQEQVQSDEKKQKEFRETLIQVRGGLKKLENQRDQALSRKQSCEEELFRLKASARKMEQECKEISESKKLFMGRLEETNANLSRLKSILEEEKHGHVQAQRENQDLKRRLAIKEEFLAKERGVLLDDIERTVGTKLKWAEDETHRLLSKGKDQEDETERLRTVLSAKDAKILDLITENQTLERRITEEKGIGRRAADFLVDNEARVRSFIENSRRDLKFLKDSLRNEMNSLFSSCIQTRCEGLVQRVNEEIRGKEIQLVKTVRLLDERSSELREEKKNCSSNQEKVREYKRESERLFEDKTKLDWCVSQNEEKIRQLDLISQKLIHIMGKFLSQSGKFDSAKTQMLQVMELARQPVNLQMINNMENDGSLNNLMMNNQYKQNNSDVNSDSNSELAYNNSESDVQNIDGPNNTTNQGTTALRKSFDPSLLTANQLTFHDIDTVLNICERSIHQSLDVLKVEYKEEEARHWAFKMRQAEEGFNKQIMQLQEEKRELETENERIRSSCMMQTAELRGNLQNGQEKEKDLATRIKGLKSEIEEVITDRNFYKTKVSNAKKEITNLEEALEHSRRETAVHIELAKSATVQAFKNQLREIFREAEWLQQRFTEDLRNRDKQWENLFEQTRQQSSELIASREKQASQATKKLQLEIEASREKEQLLVQDLAKARHETVLQSTKTLAELDHSEMERKRIDKDLQAKKDQLERSIAKVESLQRQNAELEERVHGLILEKMAGRESKEKSELLKMEGEMKLARDVASTINEQEEILSVAEQVSRRVRNHLEA